MYKTVTQTYFDYCEQPSPRGSIPTSAVISNKYMYYIFMGKRPLGRPRRRWDDKIKTDLQEVGGGCGDWMELAKDRDMRRALVNMLRNLRVPKMRGIS